MIKELEFSDLIFTKDGTAYYKRLPEKAVKAVPSECKPETEHIFEQIEQCEKDEFRLIHEGVVFRVAECDSVDGKCYFLRKLSNEVPDLHSLGFAEPVIKKMCFPSNGLIIFSGRMGSGKTTSASALIKSKLTHDGGHVVTLEDPPEFDLQGQGYEKGVCFQQDISDITMESAIVKALRYSAPEILFLGELREDKAASQALRAALNGHLIICTLHASGVVETIERLISLCRKDDGDSAYKLLSESIAGIICQRLKVVDPETFKKKMIPQYLFVDDVNRTAVRSKIRENEVHQLVSEIQAQKNRLSMETRRKKPKSGFKKVI